MYQRVFNFVVLLELDRTFQSETAVPASLRRHPSAEANAESVNAADGRPI